MSSRRGAWLVEDGLQCLHRIEVVGCRDNQVVRCQKGKPCGGCSHALGREPAYQRRDPCCQAMVEMERRRRDGKTAVGRFLRRLLSGGLAGISKAACDPIERFRGLNLTVQDSSMVQGWGTQVVQIDHPPLKTSLKETRSRYSDGGVWIDNRVACGRTR